jgi:hypothetical protein
MRRASEPPPAHPPEAVRDPATLVVNSTPDTADRDRVTDEHDQLLNENAELHSSLADRRDEIASDDRAATIFDSVEELHLAAEGESDVEIATLRQVNWGLRTVEALLEDEDPPALFAVQRPVRGAYVRTLVVAGSFGLLVALLLYELITNF